MFCEFYTNRKYRRKVKFEGLYQKYWEGKKVGNGHTSIGIWNDKKTVKDRSSFLSVPFVCLDVDSDTNLLDAKTETNNLIHQLNKRYKINPSDLIVNFSGNRGFHIRIPSSLFGRKIFRNSKIVLGVLNDFLQSFNSDLLDKGLNSGLKSIAIPMSNHRETEKKLVVWNGFDFLTSKPKELETSLITYFPYDLSLYGVNEYFLGYITDSMEKQKDKKIVKETYKNGKVFLLRKLDKGMNNVCFANCCRLVKANYLYDEAMDEILKWNQSFDNPLNVEDVIQTLNSSFNYLGK